MIELTLPAGSMQAALAAFDGGADGVYLGLKEFSARKAAKNFSFEEVAKLRSYCQEHNKRLYITLNTLIDEASLSSLTPILKHLEHIGCDGLIVQDLGVAHLVTQHTPSLPLHGSTQLAVHTADGVRELQRLGFERVVLARELTIEEVEAIRKECPDVQLKVFIHGSLCYSVSGQCMASVQVCKRSANEGACAQICRNYFSVEQDPSVDESLSPEPKGPSTAWFFSMSDLASAEAIRRLDEIGIESVKIEGRMKGPVYTKLAAQYYRALLDGEPTAEHLGEELAIAYGRRQTGGWLTGYGRAKQDFTVRSKPTLGSASFPQHRGLAAATVLSQTANGVWVRTLRPLALRDGLMYLLPGSREPIEAVRFGLFSLINEWDEEVSHVKGDQVVHISLSERESWPKVGEALYQVSSHDQNPQEYSEAIIPWAKPIDLTVTLDEKSITVEGWSTKRAYEIAFDKARSVQSPFENFSEVFSRSDTAPFTLGTLKLINNTGLAEEELFYPLSHLNEIRRAFYSDLQEAFEEHLGQLWPEEELSQSEGWIALPKRSALVDEEGLVWISPRVFNDGIRNDKRAEELLFAVDERLYFPLPPAMFEQKRFLDDLAIAVTHLEQQGVLDRVYFGLNNIGQLPFFRERGLSAFVDVYLYLSNSESAKLLLASGLRLVGGYLWLERSNTDVTRWPAQPTIVDPAFVAPAFISRSCFRHDSLHLSCKGCPHHGSWIVRGDTVDYRVIVQDCITMAIAIR